MAKYHGIETEIWEELLEYTPRIKLLYIYLFSCPQCRPSGLYKIKIKTIRTYTGCGEEDIKKICGKLIEYDFETSEIFVRGKFKRVLSGFRTNENMRKAIEADFMALSSKSISSLFINKYEGALKGLRRIPLPSLLPSLKEGGAGEEKKKAHIFSKPPKEFTNLIKELAGKKSIPPKKTENKK